MSEARWDHWNIKAERDGFPNMIEWLREYRYRSGCPLKTAKDAYDGDKPMCAPAPAVMPVDWDDLHNRLSRAMPSGIASPHNACCYREHCKALEARALAAEAALAAERERIATNLDAQADALWERCETKRSNPPSVDEQADAAQAFALQKAAAAIRAQGE